MNILDALFNRKASPFDSGELSEMQGGGGLPPIVNPIKTPEEAPINIEGFAPTKRNWLGKLADGILAAYGDKPIYEGRMRELDTTRAMKGFSSDPLTAISHLMQVPGQAEKASQLYNQYTDNQRQQGNLDRQNNVFDMKKEELVYGRVASMMAAANEKTWPEMKRLAKVIGDRYGVDVSDIIPEDYRPDSIEYIRAGAIKPVDQAKIAETERYHNDTIDTRKRGQDLSHGDRQDRISETRRHNTVTENKPRGGAPKPQAQSVMTKYGPGIVSKDGTRMLVMRGGKKYGYVNAGKNGDKINWVPAGEVEVK